MVWAVGTGGMGHRVWATWGNRVHGMGYSGYQPHGQWGNRVQGVWPIGVYGAMGYRGMGYKIHGQWVQGGVGHMGQ